MQNPWQEFSENHEKGDKVRPGEISTDFGIFVGLDGGIGGLVHMTDIAWTDSGEAVIREYKKGMEIEAVILSIDSERERISLGLKQQGRSLS